MTGSRRSLLLAVLLNAGAVCWPLPILGQAPIVPDTLSPELQKIFDQGIDAARQEEFGLAARYFTEVQEKTAASASPRVLFNLGLAHGRAGHELVGAAWLDVFLLADPHAPNAAAVRGEIDRLKAAARTKINVIFQDAVAKAQTVLKEDRRSSVSALQAKTGDIEGALATGGTGEPELWIAYAKEMADRGNVRKALDAVQKAREAPSHAAVHDSATLDSLSPKLDTLREAICNKMIEQGDYPGARNLAQQIPDGAMREKQLRQVRTKVLRNLVEKNAGAKNFDPAPIDELLSLLDDYQIDFLDWLAEKQWQTGNIPGAESTFARGQQIALDMKKPNLLLDMAGSELDLGNVDGAKQTAQILLANGGDSAIAYSILGDYDRAIAIAEETWDHDVYEWGNRDMAYGEVVYWLGVSGNIGKAKKAAKRADGQLITEAQVTKEREQEPYGVASGATEQYLARVLARDGDFKGAMEVLRPKTSNICNREDLIYSIIDDLLKKGQIGNALELANLLTKGKDPDRMHATVIGQIITAQANAGDLTGAAQTLALVPRSNPFRKIPVESFTRTQEKAGNPAAWLNRMMDYAVTVSQDKKITDPAASLRNDAQGSSAGNMVENLVNAAGYLGNALLDLNDLEDRLLNRDGQR